MVRDVSTSIKIFHIVHVDRLSSIVQEGKLISDSEVHCRQLLAGTNIGMDKIKERRLKENQLSSHPNLYVGECVPFYFCPRSVMLYVLYKANHSELAYREGQEPIVHLVADMHKTILWAKQHVRRWAFTTSNAGSRYFNDYADEHYLEKINWDAVCAQDWRMCREEKQAEFLIEHDFPWELVEFIGVYSDIQLRQVKQLLKDAKHQPTVEIRRNWYY